MKITAIRALNLLSLRTFVDAVPIDAKVILLCGPNGSGKTALIEGIRLAITGELPRGLQYKNKLSDLISQGERDGFVEVELNHGAGERSVHKTSLKTGVASGDTLPSLGSSVLALHPQWFMDNLQPHERRKALFELAGISLKAQGISAALVTDGHDAGRVKRVANALAQGFDAGSKQAGEFASEARGAWQALTGETYGAVKAETWTAPRPNVEVASSVYAAELEKLEPRLRKATAIKDSLEADLKQWTTADKVKESADALTMNRQEVDTIKARIADLEATRLRLEHSANVRGGWTAPCPACGTLLECGKAGELHEYAKSDVPPPQAAELLKQNEVSLSDARARLSTAERKLGGSISAKEMLSQLPKKPTQAELDKARDEASVVDQLWRIADAAFQAAKKDEQASLSAGLLTSDAKRRHADVGGFTALREAILNLPGKYLTEALANINMRMGTMSGVLGASVQIGQDMECRYGTIPYALASRSQQWRCALAFGIAVAANKLGLVFMDEFDLVEPGARGGILQFLGTLVDTQVVLGATLKAAPSLPPGYRVRWLGKAT